MSLHTTYMIFRGLFFAGLFLQLQEPFAQKYGATEYSANPIARPPFMIFRVPIIQQLPMLG